MFQSAVTKYVHNSIKKNCKSEYVTPDELEKVVSDSIYNFTKSRDFSRLINETLGKELRRK